MSSLSLHVCAHEFMVIHAMSAGADMFGGQGTRSGTLLRQVLLLVRESSVWLGCKGAAGNLLAVLSFHWDYKLEYHAWHCHIASRNRVQVLVHKRQALYQLSSEGTADRIEILAKLTLNFYECLQFSQAIHFLLVG